MHVKDWCLKSLDDMQICNNIVTRVWETSYMNGWSTALVHFFLELATYYEFWVALFSTVPPCDSNVVITYAHVAVVIVAYHMSSLNLQTSQNVFPLFYFWLFKTRVLCMLYMCSISKLTPRTYTDLRLIGIVIWIPFLLIIMYGALSVPDPTLLLVIQQREKNRPKFPLEVSLHLNRKK